MFKLKLILRREEKVGERRREEKRGRERAFIIMRSK